MRNVQFFAAFLIAVALAGGSAVADQKDPRLDSLFSTMLSKDVDPSDIGTIQRKIWGIWIETGDLRGDELMRKGIDAMHRQNFEGAVKLFSELIDLKPEVAEGWNKRATVFFLMRQYENSIEDVKRTLALEPRHWGAMSGLGMIYDNMGDVDAAIAAFEKALELNPYMIMVHRRLEDLYKKAEENRI